MSSRALRRLHREVDVIRLGGKESGSEDGEEENPVFQPQNKKKGRSKGFVQAVQDPFELLAGDDEEEIEEENEEKEEDGEQSATTTTAVSSVTTKQKKRKKKKKKGKREQAIDTRKAKEEAGGVDEVDAAVKEVNEMLGELDTNVAGERTEPSEESSLPHHILIVDRRFLSADNEMRRIFGSRVVREHTQRRTHRQRYQRPTILATPTDSWPKMEKLGLSMQLVEVKNGCSYFVFQHSSEYQKVQFSFWDAVETYDPNSIAAVLHAHPYHIDSLLQLSEVCKMGDDTQMAADLIERALYSFETIFHPLFNYTQANCRLDYNQAENRSFYLTLFRHLNYIGRKGCHRTAFEFCKLLLSLNPDKDPLCALLLIDYFAVRSCEYDFLINLYKSWEPHRNLSQLPNFAFSVPLAMFHCSGKRKDEEEEMTQAADKHLQNALIMFPSILLPLMDKCGVMLDPVVMTHAHFTGRSSSRDPEALQLLTKLYIERAHSLWKEPEVLTWLEANARVVVTRANSSDPLIEQCDAKRKVRYVGTPRNIYRHVIVSDLESVTGSLPTDITGTPIMMYDPLPPENSTAAYKRPPRTHSTLGENENSLSLFLRSLLPSFTTAGDTRGQVQAEGLPQPQQQPAEGAVGGEGVNLEAAVGQLTQSLRGLLDQLRVVLERPLDEDEIEQDSDDDR